jgi:hypothetical protein
MSITQGQVLGTVGGGVLVAFLVNVASNSWPGHEWQWASLGVLLATGIFVIPDDGLLRRHRYGRARWVRLLACLLVALYPVVLWSLTRAPISYSAAFVPNGCLWAASTLLLWASNPSQSVGVLAMSVVALGGSVACVAAFWTSLSNGEELFSVAYAFAGVGFILISVGFLVDRPLLLATASLFFGVGAFSFSLPFILSGTVIGGIAVMMSGVASALFGFFAKYQKRELLYTSLVLFSVASVIGGIVILIQASGTRDSALTGVGFELIGIGFVLLIIGYRFRPSKAEAIALTYTTGSAALFGATFLAYGDFLFGVAILFGSCALLVLTIALYLGDPLVRSFLTNSLHWLLSPAGTDASGEIMPSGLAGCSRSPRQENLTDSTADSRHEGRSLGLVTVVLMILAVGGGTVLRIWRSAMLLAA